MDTLSHAAWGYATLHRDRRLAWWGALAGAAPDILFFVPSRVEALVKYGRAGLEVGRDPAIWRANGPPMPPVLLEAYHHYYVYTHSLVLLALVAAIVYAVGWRRWTWLAVPYALHILMDVPTHERYLTQPFFPLSSWTFLGLSWGDPRIFVPNLVALVFVFAFIRRRRRPAAGGDQPASVAGRRR
jgi:hypothetical protein